MLCAVLGPSLTGKTTAVQQLAELIPHCKVVHLDDYYLTDSAIPIDEKLGYANWDCAEAIDWHRLKRDLTAISNAARAPTNATESIEPQTNLGFLELQVQDLKDRIEQKGIDNITFIEGFLLFTGDEELEKHFQRKLFVYGSYDVLKQRRANRVYVTAEGEWTDPPDYFDAIVWPEYVRNYKSLFTDPPDCRDLNKAAASARGIQGFDSSAASTFDLTLWIIDQIA